MLDRIGAGGGSCCTADVRSASLGGQTVKVVEDSMKATAFLPLPRKTWLLGLAAALLAAPAWAADPPPGSDTRAALAAISSEPLLQHIRVLSSDAFEGRLPATHGEELTVAYLVRESRRLGLQAPDPAGKYGPGGPMTRLRSQGGAHGEGHGAS